MARPLPVQSGRRRRTLIVRSSSRPSSSENALAIKCPRKPRRAAALLAPPLQLASAPRLGGVVRLSPAGRTKREIIRCLKRFLAREIYQRVMTDFRARQEIIQAA